MFFFWKEKAIARSQSIRAAKQCTFGRGRRNHEEDYANCEAWSQSAGLKDISVVIINFDLLFAAETKWKHEISPWEVHFTSLIEATRAFPVLSRSIMGDLASREGDISWLEHVQMGFGQFDKLELTYSHHAFRWHMFSKLTKSGIAPTS